MPMPIHAVSHTERSTMGAGRTDAILCDHERSIFAVSTGPAAVGGGRPAARIFLDSVQEHADFLIGSLADIAIGRGGWDKTQTVFRGIFEIASETMRTAYGSKVVPATSGTVLVAHTGAAAVAHIGLTRAYILKGANVVRLTTDVRDESDSELRTRLAVSVPEERGLQAMGQRQPLEVDGLRFRMKPGTTIALVSEGIAGVVRGQELAAVGRTIPTLEGLADATTRLAMTRQAVADASVVALRVI